MFHMSRSQREKGKRGERMLCTDLREALPHLAGQICRGWQSRAGTDQPDIDGVPGFWIESKFGAKPNVRAALEQAISDQSAARCPQPGAIPVAVLRDNGKDPFVAMRWSDFLVLLRKLMGVV